MSFDSLWGEEFSIKETPKAAKKIINKIKEPKQAPKVEKAIKSKKLTLDDKLKIITENVDRILGFHKADTLVIKTRQQLTEYIDKAILNKEIAIDTETNNSLDPITCKLMGPCLYTPGMKNAYIPLNHVNPETNERLEWQLTEKDIEEELSRLKDTFIIMHNGKFDYQVIKCTVNVDLKIDWDTMIGAKLLDENERSAGLKQQYISKIDPSIEKYSIDHLFEGVEYAVVDPEVFALYAATDSFMTYKLYEWQKKHFLKKENEKLYKLFTEIEMPIVTVAADMELTGVDIDAEYSELLSKKYHKKMDKIDAEISEELAKLEDKISAWRQSPDAQAPSKDSSDPTKKVKTKGEQLKDPVELTSPTQLGILLYDVLKVPVVDKKSPRGTGEDILLKIDQPLCKLILEKRGLAKLINTYIDKLPASVNPKTKRLHAHFNQYGAATGRFSSSDPNLQNIPSHNKEIRMMFKATDGYMMVGSDFSQQEPRLLAHYSGDENMINAYLNKQDLYATVASRVYGNNYWDNMEFTDETKTVPNPEGKKRRGFMKSVVLGIMYGRGAASVAEQIGQTLEEAQAIIDRFYEGFPKVKEWVDNTVKDAKVNGYVEDLWGRRRRLPDILLPKYSIKMLKEDISSDFNPLLGSKGVFTKQKPALISKYEEAVTKCKSRKAFEELKEKAIKEGVSLQDNSGFISQAERQCVNARVQGGAASMSKRAMIKVHHDPELKRMGFRLLLAVHDELIGECPKEYTDEVAERLSYLMIESAKPDCSVPMKCDAEITHCWYFEDFKALVESEFNKKIKSGMSYQEAFDNIAEERTESTIEQLHELLDPLMK